MASTFRLKEQFFTLLVMFYKNPGKVSSFDYNCGLDSGGLCWDIFLNDSLPHSLLHGLTNTADLNKKNNPVCCTLNRFII